MFAHGVASEVGTLRTVVLHRPGNELRRLTPRNTDELLFDAVPWVDRDMVGMYPPLADALTAHVVEPDGDGDGGVRVSGPHAFLPTAARAMGIDELRLIDTGLDPVTAEREQWDDGDNTLALAPGLVVAYERNRETNARLEDHGIEVLPIAGSELGTGRGGPRCMSCLVCREPADDRGPGASRSPPTRSA